MGIGNNLYSKNKTNIIVFGRLIKKIAVMLLIGDKNEAI